MRHWLCLLATWACATQIELVAVVHPQCLHCQAWEREFAAKTEWLKQPYAHFEALQVRKLTDFDDVLWLGEHNQGNVTATPAFLLLDKENDEVIASFVGYGNSERFMQQLKEVTEKALKNHESVLS